MEDQDIVVDNDADKWTVETARETYGIGRWGLNYFDINEQGLVTVAPVKNQGDAIPVMGVVEAALGDEGLHLPLIIRFQDLLRNRVERINEAFLGAMQEFEYQATYRGVYPIKVNQLREVVEEIVDAGRPYHYGMEVGSKPELYAALAVHEDPESLIICNGYKDLQFIRIALLGRKLGKKVILVVEKLDEIRDTIAMARSMNVEPLFGLRVRLMTKGVGKWEDSTGEDAKFGLTTREIVEASRLLKEADMANSLKLVHFHMGSQIPDIMTIKKAVREGVMFYVKLRELGHDLEYMDVGGGLGVDYDGSRSTFHSSVNYSLTEYARDIVYNIMDVCNEQKVPHPIIVNESGRAIVAHHSLLVIEVFEHIQKSRDEEKTAGPGSKHNLVQKIWESFQDCDNSPMEAYHDALHIYEEAQTHFSLGLIDLPSKAEVEDLFWRTSYRVIEHFKDAEYIPDDINELANRMNDQYLCNFSVFQSLLDHWGIGQLFPIMPLHRLDEEPDRRGTLVDITCDSDGRVSKFINLIEEGVDTLPMHNPNGKPYYLGIFLTGAYQEIMGDLHNLFGRVNEAHVFLDDSEEDGYYIEETITGSTMSKVLSLVQYDSNELARRMKSQFDRAIREDRLRPNESMRLLRDYEIGLKEYTYLNLEK